MQEHRTKEKIKLTNTLPSQWVKCGRLAEKKDVARWCVVKRLLLLLLNQHRATKGGTGAIFSICPTTGEAASDDDDDAAGWIKEGGQPMLAQLHSTRAHTKNKRTNQRRASRKVGGWKWVWVGGRRERIVFAYSFC